jgi:pyruvate/2-oxoglutarate dehydrogenase complex dihydrolipoamide acyltransferase (E2) component
MEYATIARWHKSEGDRVEAGEPILELETDKVTQEVTAPVSGVLASIIAFEGDEIRVGDPLATLDERGGTQP